MNKEFIPYEQALELKELGFDEPCLFLYNSTDDEPKPFLASPPEVMDWNTLYIEKTNKHLMSAPTYSQAFRWFREKHNLHVNKTGNNFYTSFNIVEPDMVVLSFKRYTDTENHYEEAELECLKKLIGVVKNK